MVSRVAAVAEEYSKANQRYESERSVGQFIS
jgi:hypothetical protein